MKFGFTSAGRNTHFPKSFVGYKQERKKKPSGHQSIACECHAVEVNFTSSAHLPRAFTWTPMAPFSSGEPVHLESEHTISAKSYHLFFRLEPPVDKSSGGAVQHPSHAFPPSLLFSSPLQFLGIHLASLGNKFHNLCNTFRNF